MTKYCPECGMKHNDKQELCDECYEFYNRYKKYIPRI